MLNFTVPVIYQRQVAIWFNDEIDIGRAPDKQDGGDHHHLWFIPVGYVLFEWNDAVPPMTELGYDWVTFKKDGKTYVDLSAIAFIAKGQMKGEIYMSGSVTSKPYKPTSDTPPGFSIVGDDGTLSQLIPAVPVPA